MRIILKLLSLNVASMLALWLAIYMINSYFPIERYDYSIGITLMLGIATLGISILICMFVLTIWSSRWVSWLPFGIITWYWVEQTTIFPIRAWVIWLICGGIYALSLAISTRIMRRQNE